MPLISGTIGARLAAAGLKLLPWVAVFAAGFIAAQGIERRAPWGLAAQRNEALADLGAWRSAAEKWQSNRDGWVAYANRLEGERQAAADDAAGEVNRCSAASSQNSSAAYDNGYLAGRRAGRLSCGASNAPATDPRPDAGPGGMPDAGTSFAQSWGQRAYRPAGDVPADGAGAQPR